MTGRAGRVKNSASIGASSRYSGHSSAEGRDIISDVLMKEKIRSLETEVCTLKTRLDALRKAKNTTIIKGGVAKPGQSQVNNSSHGNNSHSNDSSTEKCSCDARISELKRSHELEMKSQELELKRSHELEMTKLQEQIQDDTLHDKIKQLQEANGQLHRDKDEVQSQLDGVLVANAQLASCNSLLVAKCDQLLEQLSVKEANWSHREEELQLQLRQQWGERYQEWISKAENKMKELQSINQMLQTMLKTKQEHIDLQ